MTLPAGSRLGPYEVLTPLGAGGMGEVYRARDPKLGRDVALKMLPEEFFEDADRVARFEREAKSLAALNHSGIATVYAFEEIAGRHILAMELVEGEGLDERIAGGAIPLEEALSLAKQIAEALEAAHEKGIVHRDLKPANIKVTPDGKVKLLDFGLAKIFEGDSGSSPSLTHSPTLTGRATAAGVILGTAAYMSPEQARGKGVDKRSDIWAFGAVLYEMLTGRRLFEGDTVSDTLAAVLRQDIRLETLPAATPPAVRRVLSRCLERDPRQRLHDIGDARIEIEQGISGHAKEEVAHSGAATPAGTSRDSRLPWAVAAIAVVLGALSAFLSRRSQAPEELTRFTIMPPSGQNFFGMIELSPDGRRLLFTLRDEGGKNSIAVRSLDSLEMRRLPGTEDTRGAFWSPDGREIAFFSEAKLKRIGAEGGPVRTVCESGAAFSGAWSRQGTILFAKEFGTPIVAVPATGGTPQPVTAPDAARGEVAHFHPNFLPDGRHFVFVARNIDPEKTSIMLASLDSKDVRPLFHADSKAVFADPGYLLFARDNALFAQKFDPRSLGLVGEPAPAFEQVRYGTEDNFLCLSAAGNRVAYLPWLLRRRLVWVDRKGRELGTLGDIGGYEDVRLSPDGRKVAVALRDPSHGQNLNVWVLDASRGTGSRITAERTDEFDPAWFPDGERLVYVSDHVGFYDLYERPASGGAEKVLVRTKQDKGLPTVTADGRHLLYALSEGANYVRILTPLFGGGDSKRVTIDARFSEEHPEVSPDGRSTAFESNESGQREIFVQPLAGGPKRQVSIGGGQTPLWNRSGSELFYAARDGMLMSVGLRFATGRLEIGEPQPLFALRAAVSGEVTFFRRPYDVSPDGQRFLVIRRSPDSDADGAAVVTNWTAVLRKVE